ncbi:MAG: hypothetical protein M5T61_13625 [Acidimicrobiia bacterium]|nr:hypothetical protein [Acidimicrobiia bacterium]
MKCNEVGGGSGVEHLHREAGVDEHPLADGNFVTVEGQDGQGDGAEAAVDIDDGFVPRRVDLENSPGV